MCPNSEEAKPKDLNHINIPNFKDEYDYIDQLLSKGAYEHGDVGKRFQDQDWTWVDSNLLKEGGKFIEKYMFGSFMGYVIGVGASGTISSLQSVVIRTEYFFKAKRHIHSILALFHWSQLDKISDNSSPAIQHMLKVRKLHQNVFKKMSTQIPPLPELKELDSAHKKLVNAIQSDLSTINFQPRVKLPEDSVLSLTPKVWMNQLDMILGLFTVTGLLIGYPEKCGVTEEDLNSPGYKGMVQLTAIVGKVMGVSDEWNFALPYHPIDPKLACQRIWNDLYMTTCSKMSEMALATARMSFEVYWILRPFRLHFMYFMLLSDWMEVQSSNIYHEMNWVDKVLATTISWFITKYQNHNRLVFHFLNNMTSFVLFIFRQVAPLNSS